jgi:hypothetical protein
MISPQLKCPECVELPQYKADWQGDILASDQNYYIFASDLDKKPPLHLLIT